MAKHSPPPPGAPLAIGPYRLDERLGSGGMGEVYRGYDSRLDRPVALKRVRPGLSDPVTALRRFQREARAVARLRHPAIVQVFDWVEDGDEAWLVMELVEGLSLREVLRSGPLDPERGIAIARDLLEGLAVAHEADLVHRDLKPENVMLTPASSAGRGRGEQARILDFGLAKSSARSEDESGLSIEGHIVGTVSALAPEQVLGQQLDGRTDLFALGSLLYEAFSGLRPFAGGNVGETLQRICTVQPAPLDAVRPGIPPALAAFVDRLIQKDPRRRPASAAAALGEIEQVREAGLEPRPLVTDSMPTGWQIQPEFVAPAPQLAADLSAPADLSVPAGAPAKARRGFRVFGALAALFSMLGLGWFFAMRGPLGADRGVSVVVLATEVQGASGPAAELAGHAIHATLLQGLAELEGIAAFEPPRGTTEGDLRQIARETAADELMGSTLTCDEHDCRALLQRTAADGRVLWAQSFTAPPGKLLELSRTVLFYLELAYAGSERRRGLAKLTVKPADYEAFLRLNQRFVARDRGLSSDDLLAELERLKVSSPSFLPLFLLEAHASLQRFQGSRAPADLERAERALAEARRLAPGDPAVLMLEVRAARQAGDLENAAARLEEVRLIDPGNVEALLQQALLAERQGDKERAFELAHKAVAQRPAVALRLNVSDIFSRQGDFAAAREQIELALVLGPESFGALSRLAQLELSHGDLQRSVELYTQLVSRSPEATELTNLGTGLMMLGRYDEAADLFRRVATQDPASPFAALSLADIEKLRARPAEAASLYQRVVELVEADPQPAPLASVKAQALAHLGRRDEAVAALQEALRRRPDHPWTLYEAALVFTLIGDDASAGWHARRALELGIEPRWLELPFFKTVRPSLGPPPGQP